MIKKVFYILLIVILSLAQVPSAHAEPKVRYITKDGYFMAMSEGALIEALRLRELNDAQGIKKLMDQGEIGFSKPGLEVQLYSSFPFKGICQIIPSGSSVALWTEIECILD